VNNRGVVTDNSDGGKEIVGGLRVIVPINRNLNKKLFGQLQMMMDRKV
jgi:hypothetical protein